MKYIVQAIAVVVGLSACVVEAQTTLTGTGLIYKSTITTTEYGAQTTTAPWYMLMDRQNVGQRKVTTTNLLDLAGLGPTDSVTFGGITVGTASITTATIGDLFSTSITAGTGLFSSITGSGLTLTGDGNVSGNFVLGGTLDVGGAVTLSGGLTVTGGIVGTSLNANTATVLTATSTTQYVTGRVVLSAVGGQAVYASAGNGITLSAAGGITVSGLPATAALYSPRVTVSNRLLVTGTASIDGATTFGGLMTLNNDLTSTGVGTFVGLNVTSLTLNGTGIGSLVTSLTQPAGASIFSGTTGLVTFTSTPTLFGLTNTGNTTLSGNVTISGAIVASGGSTLSTLTVNGGKLTLTGSGEISLRNANNPKIEWGTTGSLLGKIDAANNASYIQQVNGTGFGWGHSSSPTVGVVSLATGILKMTNGTSTSGTGSLQGAFISTDGSAGLSSAITLSAPGGTITLTIKNGLITQTSQP